MYRLLQRNLEGYFNIHKGEKEDFRFKIAEVLKGLMSKNTYDRWEVEDPTKYAEVNHLVYHIKEYVHQFPRFETLSWDLWGMGYKAISSEEESEEYLLEKLKIINLCLETTYIQE